MILFRMDKLLLYHSSRIRLIHSSQKVADIEMGKKKQAHSWARGLASQFLGEI